MPMRFDPIPGPHAITVEMGDYGFQCLLMQGVVQFDLNVGYGVQRLVIARLDGDHGSSDREFMFALEKGGCLFLRADGNLNQFVFIEAGFDMPCAQIAVALFNAIGAARGRVEEFNRQRYPQLADRSER